VARDPQRRNFVVEFFRGVRYAFAGPWLVLTRPELWPHVLLPIFVTLVLFVVGMAGIVYATQGWVPEAGAPIDPNAPLAPLAEGVRNLLAFSLRALFLLAFGVAVYFASSIIASPFNDALSGEVERLRLGPHTDQPSWGTFFGDQVRSFFHSLLNFVVWLVWVGLGFALNLIPEVGAVLSAAVGGYATAWFIAREAMDGALSRRRLSFWHKLRIAGQHRSLFLGFGLVGAAVVWIPGVNLLVVPLSIAGGTLMYCELEQAGRIPDARGALGYVPDQPRNAKKADRRWRKARDRAPGAA
jgi:CysZ protein